VLIIIGRTILIFVALLVCMRLMGKRQLGELELPELVVAVLISDIAAQPLFNQDVPILHGLLPVAVLLLCELGIAALNMRFPKVRALMFGKPSIVISEGKIVQSEMRHNRFTLDELHEELRRQAVTDISTVKYAILETSGILNIVLYPSENAVTPSQLGLEVPDAGIPIIVIGDGRIMSRNLHLCGKNENWLKKELERRGVPDPRQVYIMSVFPDGEIYFARKEQKK
jgi:uncharacterized membrane protein YcaP (DUF421 family)